MIIAETKRLLIAKVKLEDASFFLELMNTPNWLKYIGDRNIRTIKNAEENIKQKQLKDYKKLGFGFYKVLLKEENNKTIGSCGLTKRDELEHVDIGFGFLPEYEGKGFGFESASEIMKFAEYTLKLDAVSAITDPANKNSIKLLEKLDLSYQKRIKPFVDDIELLLFVKNFN